ncbi:MAG: hypothetical protein ABWY52_09240 [Candidatus Limnocylindrales bacterium]
MQDRLRVALPVRLLAVAVGAAYVLLACGLSVPSAAPTTVPAPASATPGPPTASPSPEPSPSPLPSLSPAELEALIAEIEASVHAIRELDAQRDVPDRVVDEVALRKDMERFISEAATPEEYAAQARLGERLGYFPADTDLAALQLGLLGDQVLGYYDEDSGELAVVQRGGAFGPLERVTLAHEYTHALQDQHFDLNTLETDDLSNGDRALARMTLAEGDATLAMQQWALGNLTFEQLLEITTRALDAEQLAALSGVPRLLARQLEFPYLEGLVFATSLYQAGGWAAVDAAYKAPPASTEQIIHPEKYTSREAPVEVAPPLTVADLGEGWTEGWSDTLGELGIATWLEPTAGIAAAKAAAAGWGGDRVVMLEATDGAWLVAWRTAWDTPADADAFAFAAQAQAGTLSTPATVAHSLGSTQVEVRIASVGELLRAVPAP